MEGMKQGGSHPTQEELERLMRGQLSRQETRAVVRHLLRGCPQCVPITRRLWRLADPVEAANEVLLYDEPSFIRGEIPA